MINLKTLTLIGQARQALTDMFIPHERHLWPDHHLHGIYLFLVISLWSQYKNDFKWKYNFQKFWWSMIDQWCLWRRQHRDCKLQGIIPFGAIASCISKWYFEQEKALFINHNCFYTESMFFQFLWFISNESPVTAISRDLLNRFELVRNFRNLGPFYWFTLFRGFLDIWSFTDQGVHPFE